MQNIPPPSANRARPFANASKFPSGSVARDGEPETPATAEPSDELRILDGLRRIVRALHESSRALERDLGVTGAQLFALKILAQEPALSLSELAARTHTHQSTVSGVVKRLVAAKLVRRSISRDDARCRELVVTALGHARLKKAPLVAQERLVSGLERLAPKDRRSLARELDRLVVAMDLGEEPLEMFFEGSIDANEARTGEPKRRGAAEKANPRSEAKTRRSDAQ